MMDDLQSTDAVVIQADGFPLSPAQLGVYFDQQREETSSLYNIGQITTIDGQIDIQRFRAVAELTIAANAALNMAIRTDDGVPSQVFVDRRHTVVSYFDLRCREDGEEERQRIIDEALWRRFDLERDPLFRWVLIQANDESVHWLQVYHHIIMDGWAVALIAQRLSEYYTDLPPALDEDEALSGYLQHLRAESEYQHSLKHDKDEAYWRGVLAGDPVPLPRRCAGQLADGVVR